MSATIESFHQVNPVERFADIETEAEQIYREFELLHIWDRMRDIDRIEPSVRIATIASKGATQLNQIARESGVGEIVSPKVTFMVGLLFKCGQAIDEEMASQFNLGELDPRLLNLYKYPSYSPDRTIQTSQVLKASMLLYRMGHPKFAELILHGAHPQFFDGAELPNILVSLANSNMGIDRTNRWHSYINPAVNLFAIAPYAQWTDKMAPQESKDWIDRSHMVAINTTLQYTLQINAGLQFSDEQFDMTMEEMRERWTVVQESFRHLGMAIPEVSEYDSQLEKLHILKQWMAEQDIVARLKKKQDEGEHRIYDHSEAVAELMKLLAIQMNQMSITMGGKPLINEDYAHAIGMCHDSIKAFPDEELIWLNSMVGYGAEFEHTYPSEVVARGMVSLATSHDAKLYAWLRHFEDMKISDAERGNRSAIASDMLSGPYHLFSFMSALLSYADLAVVSNESVFYVPDITNRFIHTTLKYISDQHTAVISYAKLTMLATSLSSYLGFVLPLEGSMTVHPDNLAVLQMTAKLDQHSARERLSNISTTMKIFGIKLPKELNDLT